MSETLLFRYHGDKATLYNEVVTEPFARLMDDFVRRNPDPTAPGFSEAVSRPLTRQVYEVFEENSAMFRALFTGQHPAGGDSAPSFKGLAHFFEQSVDQVSRRYESAGQTPTFDLDIGVRLGLGMICASVLLRDALFPDAVPDREALIRALEDIIQTSLGGPAPD